MVVECILCYDLWIVWAYHVTIQKRHINNMSATQLWTGIPRNLIIDYVCLGTLKWCILVYTPYWIGYMWTNSLHLQYHISLIDTDLEDEVMLSMSDEDSSGQSECLYSSSSEKPVGEWVIQILHKLLDEILDGVCGFQWHVTIVHVMLIH